VDADELGSLILNPIRIISFFLLPCVGRVGCVADQTDLELTQPSLLLPPCLQAGTDQSSLGGSACRHGGKGSRPSGAAARASNKEKGEVVPDRESWR